MKQLILFVQIQSDLSLKPGHSGLSCFNGKLIPMAIRKEEQAK